MLTAGSTWTAAWHSLVTATLGTAISLVLGTLFALIVALTDIEQKKGLINHTLEQINL